MPSRNIEFRVGLLVILAVIIFVATILWIQGYRFGKENYRFTVYFEEVGALSAGDPVIVSGIRMGKVKELALVPGGVEVLLVLGNDVKLMQGTEITVKNIGLMGERFVAIKPGQSDLPLDLTKIIQGNYDTGIPEVMGMMGEMITELKNLVLALKGSIASEQNLEKLTQTISNFQELSSSISDYVSSNRSKLDESVSNFVESSRALKNLVARNAEIVDTVLNTTDNVARRMNAITEDLEYMSSAAKNFADKLENGDGTIQLLVEDRRLYDDLRKTADNLDDLIQDIRENPKKYIQLKLELF